MHRVLCTEHGESQPRSTVAGSALPCQVCRGDWSCRVPGAVPCLEQPLRAPAQARVRLRRGSARAQPPPVPRLSPPALATGTARRAGELSVPVTTAFHTKALHVPPAVTQSRVTLPPSPWDSQGSALASGDWSPDPPAGFVRKDP